MQNSVEGVLLVDDSSVVRYCNDAWASIHAAGREELYCASADWMGRNFFRRVESAFPIRDPELKARLREALETYLQDNTRAWLLAPDGSYAPVVRAEGEARLSAQQVLLERFARTAAAG